MKTLIRWFFKLLFLPVRGALHLLAAALKLILMLGSVVTTIIFLLFALGAAASAILGDYTTALLALGLGLLFQALPYVGAVIIAVLLGFAELLKQITTAHLFQNLEGGVCHDLPCA